MKIIAIPALMAGAIGLGGCAQQLGPLLAAIGQDPQTAVEVGYKIMNGETPAEPMILLPSELITRDNVGDYKGWSAPR